MFLSRTSIAALCLCLSTALYAQTPAATSYQISPSAASAQCLDVGGPSTANGATLQIYDCGTFTGSLNQLLQLTPITAANGTAAAQLISAYSSKCLDVDGVSTDNGAHLQQYTCGGATALNQLWTFVPFGTLYEIVSVNTGKCLDLPGGNTTHGTPLQQWDCGGGTNPNQLWTLRASTTAPTPPPPTPPVPPTPPTPPTPPAPPTPPPTAPPPAGTTIPATLFGMDLLNYTGLNPDVSFGTMRTWDAYPAVSWATLNPSRGVYNFTTLDTYVATAKARHADIIYTLGFTPDWASSNVAARTANGAAHCAPPANYQDLDNFLTALSQHLNGAIKLWEAWDEPQYWYCGTVAQLVTITQHVRTILKAADPTNLIIAPSGTTGGGPQYVQSFLQAGGSPLVDILSCHCYTYGADEGVIATLATYQSVAQQTGNAAKPFWDLEASQHFATSNGNASAQAGYAAKSYLLHWSVNVPRFVWYAFDSQDWGGMWSAAQGDQSNAIAYAQVYKWMVGAVMTTPCAADGSGLWTCTLGRANSYTAIAVWSVNPNTTYKIPANYTQYRDLTGAVTLVKAGTTITLPTNPILMETASVF